MSASLPTTKAAFVRDVIVVCVVPITKSSVLSPSSYVTVIPVSVLEPTIAPTVSEIVSASVTPSTVIASASSVPSTSTLPLISSVAEVSAPVMVIFLPPVISLSESVMIALLARTVPAVIPSSVSNSASVRTALPTVIEVAAVNAPAATIVPETSRFPLTSMVVALISISVSDTKSSTPSALW